MKNTSDLDFTRAISIAEMARRLGLSVPTARKLLDSGRVRSVRVGPRRRVVPVASLRRFLEGK